MKVLQHNKYQASDLLLLFVAATLLFSFLGARGLWAAEGRWAQVTREMCLTQDFFHPTIGGQPYFDKPLLTYWLIALIKALTGTLNELTIRLPSAVSGIVAIWAILRLGTRLWSAQVGRLAAWMLLTTYSFLFWSRAGTADLENLAVTVLAVYWYAMRRDRINFSTFLVFYLIIFVGALTKGLTAVAVPVLIICPDVLREKRWRVLFKPAHFIALALGVAAYLTPFVIASVTRPDYESSGLALVFQENIQRFFQPIDHRGPVYLYVYALPQLLLPWTPVCIVAIIALLKRWRDLDDKTRWLIQALGLVFLFFTVSGSRRSYYILPLVPFCSLLAAVFVADEHPLCLRRMRQWATGVQAKVIAGLVLFELLLPVLFVFLHRIIHFKAPLVLSLVTLMGAVAAVTLGLTLYRVCQSENRLLIASIGSMAVLLGLYFGPQQAILEANRTGRPFMQMLSTRIAGLAPNQVAIFPKANANTLFYLQMQSPPRIISDPVELKRFWKDTPACAVITQARYADQVFSALSAELQGYRQLSEEVQAWETKPSQRQKKWLAWLKQGPSGVKVSKAVGEDDHHAK